MLKGIHNTTQGAVCGGFAPRATGTAFARIIADGTAAGNAQRGAGLKRRTEPVRRRAGFRSESDLTVAQQKSRPWRIQLPGLSTSNPELAYSLEDQRTPTPQSVKINLPIEIGSEARCPTARRQSVGVTSQLKN